MDFTRFFFEYILEELSYQNNNLDKVNQTEYVLLVWSDIIQRYEEKNRVSLDSIPIMMMTSRVLQVSVEAINENLQNGIPVELILKLVSSIQDLFITEVKSSKLQKVEFKQDKMLIRMLEKSQKSILVIWKCLLEQEKN